MTGAINRRRFAKILSTDSLAATSSEHKHALLMLDIDHFKMVNDAYGHQAGDDALCALVDLCRLTLPDPFQIARIGGEEFAVLLPNTTEDMVDFLAETIRQKVDAHPFRSGHHCFNLTVSIGGTIFKERPCNPLLLLSAADSALYQAKRNGRNCVFITGRSTDTPASTTTPPTVPLGRLCDQAVVTSPLDT
ncbi:MAG: GGDEF domain-containing protein [Pseudomonadota bacterium]